MADTQPTPLSLLPPSPPPPTSYLQVNQIGTVSESIEAVKMSKAAGWGVMTSHRCGDVCVDTDMCA
jgi:hypothetical protein